MIRRTFEEWLHLMIKRRTRIFNEVVKLRRLADEEHVQEYNEAADILSERGFMIMRSIRIARQVHDDRARKRATSFGRATTPPRSVVRSFGRSGVRS